MKTYVLLLINTKRYKQSFKTDNVNIKNCSTLCKIAANMTLCLKTNQVFQNQQTSNVFERHNLQQKRQAINARLYCTCNLNNTKYNYF